METISGLWKSRSDSGISYLRARVKTEVVIQAHSVIAVFPNKFKDKPSDPDYRLVLLETDAFADMDVKKLTKEESGKD